MRFSLKLPFVVSALILPLVVSIALAQQDTKSTSKADAKAADKSDSKTAKTRAPNRGRLPPYYPQVVNGQQRDKIYSIQQQYAPKIAALKAELAALQDKQNAEIEAVLTPEQLATVKKLTDDAKAKRKAAGGTSTATEEAGEGDEDADDAVSESKATDASSKTTGKSGK